MTGRQRRGADDRRRSASPSDAPRMDAANEPTAAEPGHVGPSATPPPVPVLVIGKATPRRSHRSPPPDACAVAEQALPEATSERPRSSLRADRAERWRRPSRAAALPACWRCRCSTGLGRSGSHSRFRDRLSPRRTVDATRCCCRPAPALGCRVGDYRQIESHCRSKAAACCGWRGLRCIGWRSRCATGRTVDVAAPALDLALTDVPRGKPDGTAGPADE